MRFTLISFAVLAVALTATMVSADESNVAEDAIEMIYSGGDPMGDDDYSEPVRRSKKHAHKSGRKSSDFVSSVVEAGAKLMNGNTQITWYASHDLKNPQCGGGSKNWNPTNTCHIGAVMAGWNGGPKCGEFVQLCNDEMKPKKCVKVRIVDKCAGCKENHVDLTKSAFKQLAPSGSLDEGVVKGLKLYENKKPSPWDFDLFGPLKLN